jgi:Holliday junction resolvase
MTNYARRGNSFDVEVAKELEDRGWLVGSRRHIGGAGDLIAIHPAQGVRLLECKTTASGPYHSFGPGERHEMRKLATELGVSVWLVWKPPGGKIRWLPASSWPNG